MVMMKLKVKASQTTAIRMSIGHSSSAYSFDWVSPKGSVSTASTMTAFQPQKVKRASLSLQRRTPQVRWTE